VTIRWPHALAILALLLVAFAAGRFTAPRPEEHLALVEREESSTTEEVADQLEERVEVEHQEERVRIVYRDRWRTPDGAERETELELDTETARAILDETRVETRVEERAVEVVREVEVFREIRTPLPDWRVGGLVGLELDAGAPVYGLQLERRLLGPIHVGAWGLSSGAVGIGVSVTF